MKDGFEIRRIVRRGKLRAVTKTVCPGGIITVITDEEGEGAMMPYTQALSGKKTDDQFQFLLGTSEYSLQESCLVGFSESLPEQSSIADFLKQCGYSGEEIPQLMTTFDFDDVSYMNCGQLPVSETRRLLLLQRLKQESPVLILNDPFSPFNGRWKEHFAEALLEYVEASHTAVLVANLSFTPSAWERQERVKFVDVGKAAVRAAKRAEQQARLDEAAKVAAEAVKNTEQAQDSKSTSKPTEADTESAQQNRGDAELPFELPEHFAYREVIDWLFAPLARISRLFRGYGGLAVPLGIALLVVTMGVVMFPNMGKYREKLKTMARSFTFEQPINSSSVAPKMKTGLVAQSKKSSPQSEQEEGAQVNATRVTIQDTGQESFLDAAPEQQKLTPEAGHMVDAAADTLTLSVRVAESTENSGGVLTFLEAQRYLPRAATYMCSFHESTAQQLESLFERHSHEDLRSEKPYQDATRSSSNLYPIRNVRLD